MSGRLVHTVSSYAPGAAIAAYRIVKFGSADNAVIQAAAATDAVIGVANELGALSTDPTVDITMGPIGEVELGGTVTRGDPLTADSAGKGVAAAPAPAANARIIGFANKSGVAGDIITYLHSPGFMQG